MARHPAPELLQGYVARQRGDRWDVAFGKPSAGRDTFYVTFEVRQRDSDPNAFDVVPLSPARAETGYYARAMRAIALATADFGPQNRPYNPVVLERPNGLLWVYLIPAQLRVGVYPLGADVRYLVAADGRSILASPRCRSTSSPTRSSTRWRRTARFALPDGGRTCSAATARRLEGSRSVERVSGPESWRRAAHGFPHDRGMVHSRCVRHIG